MSSKIDELICVDRLNISVFVDFIDWILISSHSKHQIDLVLSTINFWFELCTNSGSATLEVKVILFQVTYRYIPI